LVFRQSDPTWGVDTFLAHAGNSLLRRAQPDILGPLCRGWILSRRVLSIRGGISVAAGGLPQRLWRSCASLCGSRSLLAAIRCELEIPLYPPHRFFNRDYSVFDCGSMFSEANLKPFVRVCSSLPGEPPRSQLSGGSGPIAGYPEVIPGCLARRACPPQSNFTPVAASPLSDA